MFLSCHENIFLLVPKLHLTYRRENFVNVYTTVCGTYIDITWFVNRIVLSVLQKQYSVSHLVRIEGTVPLQESVVYALRNIRYVLTYYHLPTNAPII
jgi:hypothetical protein